MNNITDNCWIYFDPNTIKYYTSIEDFDGAFGFIYKIQHKESKRYYIGKKVLQNNITKKLTKKQLADQSGRGRKPTTEVIQKESNWKNYWGSSKDFLEYIKQEGEDKFERKILYVVPTKKLLTYYEIKAQMENNCLENPLCYCDNINGKFFRKDFLVPTE
jgi:hypothetical protein